MLILMILSMVSPSFADASDATGPLATCVAVSSGKEHEECVDKILAELRLRKDGGGAVITAPATTGPKGQRGQAGKDGKNTLSFSVGEPVGGTLCPNGGIKTMTGLDVNGDGIVQTTEVEYTSWVCNGAGGTKGDKGDKGDPGVGTNGTNGRDAPPVRLAVTGVGGGLFIDDPHQEGTHLEALWTSGITAAASQLKPSGVGWEVSATVFVAGSASAGASGGAGLFYGSSRGRLGVRAEYLHLAPSILDNGLVPFNGDGGQVRLFVEFNPRIDGHFFLTGSVGGACLWLTDGNGALLSGVPVANAGLGYRF